MSHRDRVKEAQGSEGGKRPTGRRKEDQQADLLNNVMEQVRTLDSEIDLLKQKMNLIIREVNVLKRVVLLEKKDIRDIQGAEEEEKSRFDSLVEIVRGVKEGSKD